MNVTANILSPIWLLPSRLNRLCLTMQETWRIMKSHHSSWEDNQCDFTGQLPGDGYSASSIPVVIHEELIFQDLAGMLTTWKWREKEKERCSGSFHLASTFPPLSASFLTCKNKTKDYERIGDEETRLLESTILCPSEWPVRTFQSHANKKKETGMRSTTYPILAAVLTPTKWSKE
jgi:hypothetical protein